MLNSSKIAVGMTLLALVGSSAWACTSRDEVTTGSALPGADDVGSVGLTLQPVNGLRVSSVHYVVTDGDPASVPAPSIVSEGNLPTPGTASAASFGLPLPVGGGYYLSLSAVAVEAEFINCTGVYGPFAVTANTSTPFNMTLSCVDYSNGSVVAIVDVATDACPRLIVDYVVAEPGAGFIGGSIAVHSLAHDLDNPAEVISYVWSIVDPAQAGVGQFVPASARDTRFDCTGLGDSVRIKVTAANHQCQTTLETLVSCTDGGGCGNGVVDVAVGETCDPGVGPGHPADPTCPADCTKVCGDGNAEGDEECDAALDPHGARTCSDACERVATDACVACEQAGNCFASSDNCAGPAGSPFTLDQRRQCFNVMLCVQGSNCLDGDGSLTKCYCGTLPQQDCIAAPFDLTLPGAPNGPCALVMQQGSPALTTNVQVLGGLTNISRPTGVAGGRLECQKDDPICAQICGVE